MVLTIYWTDFAKNELNKIFEYHKEKASLTIARKLITGIIQKAEILKTLPESGQKEELLENRIENFRYLVHKRYKIIYWINPQANQIEITDVFDTRQNPTKIFRE